MSLLWFSCSSNGQSYWSSDSGGGSAQLRLTGQRIGGLSGSIESANVYTKGRNNELDRLKQQLTTIEQSNSYAYKETLMHYNLLKDSSPTAGIRFTLIGGIMGYRYRRLPKPFTEGSPNN
ncbi:Hypothetical protein DEACI_3035 [Acididesulfobacillus acetoxydans]|uniref:Uncharacterized protein n=1 Tax=Acididesulfobacillus acetoxydans TaxID=1561005 RepID=A0A8S0X045_9FIRM|nr:Hypothetical protein DEACI_3035 [Acididesulfobacillus acetoxydans]CEJ08404.1 Hypothetical protein DEACI_2880 [Acididesulfobacillus acetoxydans]